MACADIVIAVHLEVAPADPQKDSVALQRAGTFGGRGGPRERASRSEERGHRRHRSLREIQRLRIRQEVWVSALVHATPDATASRFAGRSANKTPPITMKKTTSVKSLWTP